MKVFWQKKVIRDDLWKELGLRNAFGTRKSLSDVKSELRLYMQYSLRSKDGEYMDEKGRKFALVLMDRSVHDVMKDISGGRFAAGKYHGFVLGDLSGRYISWSERSIWVDDFLKELKALKVQDVGLVKTKSVYVKVMDTAAVADLWGRVTGVFVYPFNGVVYGEKFLTPVGGEMSTRKMTSSIEAGLGIISSNLGVSRQGIDFVDWLMKLQLHSFNYAVYKHRYFAKGNLEEDFQYNEMLVDENEIIDLTLRRSMLSDTRMLDLVDESTESINNAVATKNVDGLIKSVGRLYSILLARVEYGTQTDSANKSLSDVVSKDLYKALKYGQDFVKLIGKVKAEEFSQKIEAARVILEGKRVAKGGKASKVEDEAVWGVLTDLKEEDLDKMVEQADER